MQSFVLVVFQFCSNFYFHICCSAIRHVMASLKEALQKWDSTYTFTATNDTLRRFIRDDDVIELGIIHDTRNTNST